MSKIGTTEIERIARLARIGLTPEEVSTMAVEIGQILEFVEQLSQVDITGVDPTDQVTGLEDVWREDVVRRGLSREELLAGVPEQKDGYIVVKRVLNG
jgi:aspartyl-tRNA(Asn)/glutamyl-tRNA(Gln) amidotransferase subunit C